MMKLFLIKIYYLKIEKKKIMNFIKNLLILKISFNLLRIYLKMIMLILINKLQKLMKELNQFQVILKEIKYIILNLILLN